MISKIIQKEKDRQDINIDLLKVKKELFVYGKRTERDIRELMDINYEHKQSLINLKEYMEETYDKFVLWTKHQINMKVGELYERDLIQLKEDLNEIELMIERYKNV